MSLEPVVTNPVNYKVVLADWLPAQRHSGEDFGDTEAHLIFVKLKR
jgi:hypothetical protein